MLGVGEGGVGRVLVAHHQRERDIVRRLVPHRRRAGLDRILDADDRRQRLVVDLDQFGGVSRLRSVSATTKATRSPTARTLSAFEDRAQRAEAFRAAHVLGHRRRQAAELVGRDIGAGEHGEHAGRGLGLGGIDALDAGMGVRRHDHDAVALLRQVDVVDIAAAAGDETRVLDPGHGLTDAELVHAHLLEIFSLLRCASHAGA